MKYFIFIFLFFFTFISVQANSLTDSDKDGVPDDDEIHIYFTDPQNSDSDSDGYSDWEELNNGYSPHNFESVKLEDNDYDNDGLSDRMELNFKTDLTNPDTDGDGYNDGEEVNNGYDPLSLDPVLLGKHIEVNTEKQELYYFLGGVKMGTFIISSGVNNSTPIGNHVLTNKHPKAWSPYGLWMPYWMGLGNGRYGLHELPIWPNGYTEGEDQLGTPASHGCVRLGTDSAEFIYNWSEVGMSVIIY